MAWKGEGCIIFIFYALSFLLPLTKPCIKFLLKKLFWRCISFLLVPLAFSWFTSRLSLGFSLISSIYLSSFLSPVDCRVSINSRIHSQQKVVFLTLNILQEIVINLLIFLQFISVIFTGKILRIRFVNILKILKS